MPTAGNAAPSTMANNIYAIFNNRYAQGYNDGKGYASTNVSVAWYGYANEDGPMRGTLGDINMLIFAGYPKDQNNMDTSVTNATKILDYNPYGGGTKIHVYVTAGRGLAHNFDCNIGGRNGFKVAAALRLG